jgi:Na+:H+ antiporter
LALALALPPSFPLYNEILVTAFGVVVFSVVVQGLTMPLLLRKLKFHEGNENIDRRLDGDPEGA